MGNNYDGYKEQYKEQYKERDKGRYEGHKAGADVEIRAMIPADYDAVYALWQTIAGFGIRSIDDSRDGVIRFIRRNPTTSMVAFSRGEIVGSLLCGHDGRTGCLYHVCVHRSYRRRGIGNAMVGQAMDALRAEGISRVSLIAFTKNNAGNAFWHTIGWQERSDLNYYDFSLNDANETVFNESEAQE